MSRNARRFWLRYPALPNHLRLCLAPRRDLALKRFRHCHNTIEEPIVRLDRRAVCSDLGLDVEGPEHASHVDVQRVLGDMAAGTDAAAGAVAVVVARVRVGRVEVVRGVLWVLKVALGLEGVGFGVDVGVVVDGPG